MHNLVIDIGNTNSKIAVFDDKVLVFFQSADHIDQHSLSELIDKYKIVSSTVSSVKEDVTAIVDVLKSGTNYIPFSTQMNTGVKNYYQTRETLGQDRWAKVIAVHHAWPQQNCLIIDAGTCITYDLLNEESAYFGGSISLGIKMRFEALHHYTGKLPLVKWDKEVQQIPEGTDTQTAIINGVLQGLINEVEGFISLQNIKNTDLKVVITGGDATFLLEQLKNSIFAPQIIHDPYLVLKGLNEVIAFEYVQKD
ncbi:type III pantothenate kinase [Pedobacter westerhofensis]|uniref:Type III pantothenate kinase n=1 Tax=Pedobacter westerhofensis TaxID=425512 RepID=A0A521CBU2_9SPHI|nr:type III pantothenate kinase [Pedobacter westerhofensis]SMO56868.1 type III pantothenate kinase [Pedobacter westerhofensis]